MMKVPLLYRVSLLGGAGSGALERGAIYKRCIGLRRNAHGLVRF
jgi:hypothetical protein